MSDDGTWRDLSDDELRARLVARARVTDPEFVAGELVLLRDDPDVALVIDELLDD